ncbi:SRPBCC family protein [Paenibacillus sp. NEAU-GSW1]|uniref:SRPBCC family protein n=1 Tax=Paenibacillus sp. NEAU-GSW1 TaxID=2682486 RepID=UPI0012E30E28|nr:SRPBCC family protein [Paenibacillus sp. NEAU-GSW1]MUT65371.1 hypothetical protein [Paenibacillus sp. NEAU-GSW1]
MMRTYNEITMQCSADTAFQFAKQVESWPELLSHYRSVTFRQGDSSKNNGLVEMAAVRPFNRLRWPVRWTSQMEVNESRRLVKYLHVRGVTRGMEVEWRLEREDASQDNSVIVSIVHRWRQPPFGRRLAAGIIGRLFVHAIAQRTLQGLKRHAEHAELLAISDRKVRLAEHTEVNEYREPIENSEWTKEASTLYGQH